MSVFKIKVRGLGEGRLYLLLDREDGSPVFRGEVNKVGDYVVASGIDHPKGLKTSGFIRSLDGKRGAFITGKLR